MAEKRLDSRTSDDYTAHRSSLGPELIVSVNDHRNVSRKQTVQRLILLQLVVSGVLAVLALLMFSDKAALAILSGAVVSTAASGFFGWIAAQPAEDSSSRHILAVFMLGELGKLAIVAIGFTVLFVKAEFLREGLYAVIALVTFLLLTLMTYIAMPNLQEAGS